MTGRRTTDSSRGFHLCLENKGYNDITLRLLFLLSVGVSSEGFRIPVFVSEDWSSYHWFCSLTVCYLCTQEHKRLYFCVKEDALGPCTFVVGKKNMAILSSAIWQNLTLFLACALLVFRWLTMNVTKPDCGGTTSTVGDVSGTIKKSVQFWVKLWLLLTRDNKYQAFFLSESGLSCISTLFLINWVTCTMCHKWLRSETWVRCLYAWTLIVTRMLLQGERLFKKTVQEGPRKDLSHCRDWVEPHPVHLPIISKGAKPKAWAAVIQATHTYYCFISNWLNIYFDCM